ncbi:hypothetical protein BU16DRAFT_566251 [Lophium mytilinum]|uniref:Uncharacterized protein n=1 Tax=Lophium mytilinum TaxID=390894 RepID=A0A6A6QDK3_9PEZI|nr:hypothetical protein BU16DRAFT_566251 [Lophium mytilinum]
MNTTHPTIHEESGDISMAEAPQSIQIPEGSDDEEKSTRPSGVHTHSNSAEPSVVLPTESLSLRRSLPLKDIFSRLQKIVDLEQEEAEEWGEAIRAMARVSARLVSYLEDRGRKDLRRGGYLEVDQRIEWAKWAAKAAKAGVFHEATRNCKSIEKQVEAWGINT